MHVTHDPEVDAIYIRLCDVPYAFGHNLDAERRIDYGDDQQPLGIELLGVSHGVNVADLPDQAAVIAVLEQRQIKTFA